MASDFEAAQEAVKKLGLDLVQVIRDTHSETAMKLGVLLDNYFELALKAHMWRNNIPVNDGMFKNNGELSTLDKKIKRARTYKLIDRTRLDDADLVRKIRNKFGHEREKLHFDSGTIAALAEKLSTYADAQTNQDAILDAVGKITDELTKVVRQGGP
jgi:hypothetical protein